MLRLLYSSMVTSYMYNYSKISIANEAKRTVLAFNLPRSKRKGSFTLGKVKYRSETNSINLQLVKIETKTNLVLLMKDWKRNELLVPKLLKIEEKTNWVS
jgi:hypothetical protein